MANAENFVTRNQLEACTKLTRLRSRHYPNEGELDFYGLLLSDLRVGTSLVLLLEPRHRLVTSRIRRIHPISPDTVEVETGNSRYRLHQLTTKEEPRRPA